MSKNKFNPLNADLNPICHLLALLGARHIFHVSRIRVNNKEKIIRTQHFKATYALQNNKATKI
jgi:hypothetical protein